MEVRSEMIDLIHWSAGCPTTRDSNLGLGTLYVQFKDGSIYMYEKVPVKHYFALAKADSIGKYFIKNIKDVYGYQKI